MSFTLAALLGLGGCTDPSGDDTSPSTATDGGAEDAPASDTESGAEDAPASDGAPTVDAPADTTPFDAAGEPPLTSKTFALSAESFLNPERGWMQGDGFALSPTADFSGMRAAGYSVVYANVRLDAFRTSKTFTPKFLADLDAGFARVRAGKIKVVLRFTYNNPNDGSTQDAALDVVLEHIKQLGGVVKKNADVVAVWQAGFIGQWGEWHSSTNGLLTPAARKAIIEAIVAELPPGLFMQIRTPMFKAALFPTALTDAKAFDGSTQARIGHHNDCYLASANDLGTYDAPIETWKTYVQNDTRFTPMGGETCGLFPSRTDCAPALAETKRLHWSFLNNRYSDKVIAAWKTQGCYDELGKRLGYRIGLTDAKYSSMVRPGGVLQVKLTLQNEGFASFYNPRPVFLVLDDGTTLQKARLSGVDPRRFAPGAAASIDVRLRVPVGTKVGKHKLALWMPDSASGLQPIPEYSVRLANAGVWDATKGYNVITDALTVDASAGGAIDSGATTFVELE